MRVYNYIGELKIKKSRVLKTSEFPREDTLKWLFLVVEKYWRSFFYEILDPEEATYNVPFKINMSFVFNEDIDQLVKIGETYEVMRGHESIGSIKILDYEDT